MARQPATHISEPTPRKQPRSCFFRAGCGGGTWDHRDLEEQPSPTVSWSLDHPRDPQGMQQCFEVTELGIRWSLETHDKVCILALMFFKTQARMEQRQRSFGIITARGTSLLCWTVEGRDLLPSSLYPGVLQRMGRWVLAERKTISLETVRDRVNSKHVALLIFHVSNPYYVLGIHPRC